MPLAHLRIIIDISFQLTYGVSTLCLDSFPYKCFVHKLPSGSTSTRRVRGFLANFYATGYHHLAAGSNNLTYIMAFLRNEFLKIFEDLFTITKMKIIYDQTKAKDLNFTFVTFWILCNGHADSLVVKKQVEEMCSIPVVKGLIYEN